MRNPLWSILVAYLFAQGYCQQNPETVREQDGQQSLLNQSQLYLAALQAALVDPTAVNSTKQPAHASSSSIADRASRSPASDTAATPSSAVNLTDVKHCFGCRQLPASATACSGSELVCVSESIFNFALVASGQDPSYGDILSDLISNGLSCRTLPSSAAKCADVVPADYSLLFNHKVCCQEVQQAEVAYAANGNTPTIGINGSKQGLLPVYAQEHLASSSSTDNTTADGVDVGSSPKPEVSNMAYVHVPCRLFPAVLVVIAVLVLLL